MERYHINWNTGMPAFCSRTDCDEEHRPDPVTASRDIYEATMAKWTVPTPWTKRNRPR